MFGIIAIVSHGHDKTLFYNAMYCQMFEMV